jgi:serine/threonine-protein kinase
MIEPGTTLDGLYRIDRLIGAGGVGAVYAAWHLHLSRPVAIKVLHPQYAAQQELLLRFDREARLLGKLDHECFVTVYDFSHTLSAMPYLVMELAEGETLRARLSRGALSLPEVLALYRPLCEALSQAHQQQILHRDLKPENLMLSPSGGVKILDFGMAKLMSGDVPLTQDQIVMGTPQYLAPERARADSLPDPSSDVFALGVMLYEVLTGKMAFQGENSLAIMRKVMRSPVPSLAVERPDLLPELLPRLDRVIAGATAKDRRRRYQTAIELWLALSAAASGKDPEEPAAAARGPGSAAQPTVDGPADPQPAASMKAGIFHAIFDYIHGQYGDDGLRRVYDRLGPERAERLVTALPTAWIQMSELADLHDAINQSFDDGSLDVMRNLGAHFATLALSTVYKAFLLPGSPETFIRRAQVMYSAFASTGQTTVTPTGDGRYCMEIRNLPPLDRLLVANASGWLRRYLSLAGAFDIAIEEHFDLEADKPVGKLLFSFKLPDPFPETP